MSDSSHFDPNELPTPQAFDLSEDVPTSNPGNRPAAGAKHATPGEVLSQEFQASDNAGDFLGLDTEFDMDAPAEGLDLTPAPRPDLPPGDTEEYDPDYDAGYDSEFDPDEEGELADEFSADLEGEEVFDEALAEAALDEEPEGSRHLGLAIAGAFCVGLLAVLGVVYGPGLLSKGDRGTDVAKGPPEVATDPTGSAANPLVDPAPLDPVVPDPVFTDPEVAPLDPDPIVEDVLPPEDPGLSPTIDIAGGDPNPADPAPLDLDLTGTGVTTAGDPLTAPSGGELVQGSVAPVVPSPMPELNFDMAWANGDELDMIWRGTEVPMEAITGPARLMLPRVGYVRVHMESGEVFEGRMYAVGQMRVWIDAEPGRVGLDGERVTQIERLPQELASVSQGGPVPTGERVRVSVPGGTIFGRVLSQTDETVTLVTDGGGKVTVREAVLEPVRSGRAVVVKQ